MGQEVNKAVMRQIIWRLHASPTERYNLRLKNLLSTASVSCFVMCTQFTHTRTLGKENGIYQCPPVPGVQPCIYSSTGVTLCDGLVLTNNQYWHVSNERVLWLSLYNLPVALTSSKGLVLHVPVVVHPSARRTLFSSKFICQLHLFTFLQTVRNKCIFEKLNAIP